MPQGLEHFGSSLGRNGVSLHPEWVTVAAGRNMTERSRRRQIGQPATRTKSWQKHSLLSKKCSPLCATTAPSGRDARSAHLQRRNADRRRRRIPGQGAMARCQHPLIGVLWPYDAPPNSLKTTATARSAHLQRRNADRRRRRIPRQGAMARCQHPLIGVLWPYDAPPNSLKTTATDTLFARDQQLYIRFSEICCSPRGF